MAVGRLLRFDEARGYGFIRPHDGGADVFMHANDFVGEVESLEPGMVVEFEVTEGDRGLRAISARTIDDPAAELAEAAQPGCAAPQPTWPERSKSGGEALSVSEFMREVTDMLIDRAPSATGLQIAQIRKCFGEVARSHGWVLD